MITQAEALVLAREHSITPAQCPQCLRSDWLVGYDNGRGRTYVGYQCRGCGDVRGLTRAHIVRVANERCRT